MVHPVQQTTQEETRNCFSFPVFTYIYMGKKYHIHQRPQKRKNEWNVKWNHTWSDMTTLSEISCTQINDSN